MQKKIYFYIIVFILLISIDQYLKVLFVNGFRLDGNCLSLTLAFNKGVAFSMLSFLNEDLKYIQIGVILLFISYLYFEKEIFRKSSLAFVILFSGAIGNIIDRFHYGAVVDYVYWHCGFDFAIFNFADMIIDLAVILIIWNEFKKNKNIKVF